MGDETPRTTRDPLAAPKCPACGSALAVAATRHKVLGAWVPEWQVRPCRNPDCPLHEAVESEGSEGTEATTTQVTGKNGENGRSPATG
ncbi:hypothetical protein ACF1CG_01130 [Streptomyces sp. NPDC014773]|uniref:hypothetical protein n=1 Tax=Streptomyces sp. NPDC014773 TaxID=3364908 RepID=UPI003700ACB2